LLVAVILVTVLVTTYSIVRNSPFDKPPKVLGAIDEMNLAVKRMLEFTVGYYGSILQVTGNATYAQSLAANYLYSGLLYIANTHPEWSPSFSFNYSNVNTDWFKPTSRSGGNLSVTYSLQGMGVENVNYATSCELGVQIVFTNTTHTRIKVTKEDARPVLTLTKENFNFYSYNYANSTWTTVNPTTLLVFSNGTYTLNIPSGVDSSAYMVQVADTRGIMVSASKLSYYTYSLSWNSTLYSTLKNDVIVVEALQNGTLRWLGQNLQLTAQGRPLPPIPIKSFRINQTISGVNRQVPFQVEDWGSEYRVPLGLSSNASLFSSQNMLVFLLNHNISNVRIWWDGRDTATQTSYAFTNRYFTGDDPASRRLTNGILTLTISSSGFTITSSIQGGSITSTASFMRINNENPAYGAGPSYVIHHGIVRDILQQEAEWSTGAPNSPNVYSQMYFTLPANATYYTYALRTLFVNSLQSRTLTDLSAIRLSVSGGSQRTENGTSGGYPVSSSAATLFYNFTSFQNGWAHHWSEFISGSAGSGIMFTDSANRKLYVFDSIAGQKTGALNVMSSGRVIEFNPVGRSQYPATFQSSLDVTWFGAVVNFNGGDTIYPTSGNKGLWIIVEKPPIITIS